MMAAACVAPLLFADRVLAATVVWIVGPGDRHSTIIIHDIKKPPASAAYQFVGQGGEVLATMEVEATEGFNFSDVLAFAFTAEADALLEIPISHLPVTFVESSGLVIDDGSGGLYSTEPEGMSTLVFELAGGTGDPTGGSIMFGHFPRPDAQSLTIRGGQCDCLAPPSEPTSPRPELLSFAASINPNPGPSNFDDVVRDTWFAHSFENLPMGCILGGTLIVTAKPNTFAENDTFWLGQVNGPGTTLGNNFAGWRFGPFAGTLPVLFPGLPWDVRQRPALCGSTTLIDLNTVVGAGPGTLLDRMNALGVLDVFAEDDTSIDCLVLELEVDPACMPRCRPCPGDFDGDGTLDIFDFLAFQSAFSMGCP